VWNIATFKSKTVRAGQRALKHAAQAGAGFDVSCMFCGYVLEMLRQKGWSGNLQDYWRAAAPTHRYSKGKNAENYRSVGLRILCSMASEAGLSPDAPAQAVWDKLFAEA
jgi:hypothetical protein